MVYSKVHNYLDITRRRGSYGKHPSKNTSPAAVEV